MSVITLTAVGFHEVHPLTQEGRYLTMILLGLGVTGLGIWFALITSLIVDIDLKYFLRRRRTMREIEALSGHLIVCGAGRTGKRVAEELIPSDKEFVLIDVEPARLAAAHDIAGEPLLAIEGDATHDATLIQAGIERASALVATLSRDEDNRGCATRVSARRPG